MDIIRCMNTWGPSNNGATLSPPPFGYTKACHAKKRVGKVFIRAYASEMSLVACFPARKFVAMSKKVLVKMKIN